MNLQQIKELYAPTSSTAIPGVLVGYWGLEKYVLLYKGPNEEWERSGVLYDSVDAALAAVRST